MTPRELVQALREAALRHDHVEEGVACAGTVLESATFKANQKAFLFVSEKHARLRLVESRAEAEKLAKKEPERYVIGPQGWAKIMLTGNAPLDLLTQWVDESYRAVTRKRFLIGQG